MTVTARAYAYVASLLLAFGSVAPWMQVNGEPGGASPLGLGTMLLITAGVLAGTVRRRRAALGVLAVLAGLLAVYAVWAGAGSPMVRVGDDDGGSAVVMVGGGLSVILLGAMLLYVASWLPAPRQPAAVDQG